MVVTIGGVNALSAENWPVQQLQRLRVRQVLVCGRQLHPPLYSHVVNFPRLEFPVRGCYENKIEAGGEIVTARLRPGSALFVPPNCWNLPAWNPGVELMSLLFGVKQIGFSVVTSRRPQGPQLVVRKFSIPAPRSGPLSPVLEAMTQLQGCNDDPEILSDLARVLIRCVQQLLRQPALPASSGRAHRLLESISVFLQNHYQYEITRDSVAEQFGITPSHLSRLFQTHGHMTFSSYLKHVRTDRAKHMLSQYDFKLDEIAARCGYYDAPHFCRVFKHLTKMTPAEYRVKSR
ncbi:MAG TPA: AraC family transcriptional regulator [Verrucomicrobiae bacterium]|nr:AraC family transcriptional regulator [Verrucomicrobiae bacterium]